MIEVDAESFFVIVVVAAVAAITVAAVPGPFAPPVVVVELLLGIVFFDTCVSPQAGIDCLLSVIPADNVLFASEMVGAVRGVDPETGHHYDDTRRYVDAAGLDAAARAKVFEANARRVYPRLEVAP